MGSRNKILGEEVKAEKETVFELILKFSLINNSTSDIRRKLRKVSTRKKNFIPIFHEPLKEKV